MAYTGGELNEQNEKWDYPVWFLFYNKDESFHEIQDLIDKLKRH